MESAGEKSGRMVQREWLDGACGSCRHGETGSERKGTPPGRLVEVTAGGKSRPMCSYPEYPKYVKGPAEAAESSAR